MKKKIIILIATITLLIMPLIVHSNKTDLKLNLKDFIPELLKTRNSRQFKDAFSAGDNEQVNR